MSAAESQVQVEKMRRFVDEWGSTRGVSIISEDNAIGALNKSLLSSLGSFPSDTVKHYPWLPFVEASSIPSLIQTDNVPFNKLATVLAYSCCHIRYYKERVEQLYPALLSFGSSDGQLQAFSSFLPTLQLLLGLVQHLRIFLRTLVDQSAALFASTKMYAAMAANLHFQVVFRHLADGFQVLLTLDSILSFNTNFSSAISCFTRSIHGSHHSHTDLLTLRQVIHRLADHLVKPQFFQTCIQEDFVSNHRFSTLGDNARWIEEITFCIQSALTQTPSSPAGQPPLDAATAARCLAVFVPLSWISDGRRAVNKSMANSVWTLHATFPSIPLFSVVGIHPLPFLAANLPPSALAPPWIKSSVRETAMAVEQKYLAALALPSRQAELQSEASSWIADIDTAIPVQGNELPTVLQIRLQLYMKGVALATEIQTLMFTVLSLHATLQSALPTELSRLVLRLTVLLKAMEHAMHRKRAEIALTVPHIVACIQRQMALSLSPLQEELQASLSGSTLTKRQGPDELLLDHFTAVTLCMDTLHRPATLQRRTLLTICLQVLDSCKVTPPGGWSTLRRHVDSLDAAVNVWDMVGRATDCSFLFWHRQLLLPHWLAEVMRQRLPAAHLQCIVSAILEGARHFGGAHQAGDALRFDTEMVQAVSKAIISPLCKAVEMDLRFHVHCSEEDSSQGIQPASTGVRDMASFLDLPRVHLLLSSIHIKSHVHNYLNAAFFDYSAAEVNDSEKYEAMAVLAGVKYGLSLSHTAVQVLPPPEETKSSDTLAAALSDISLFSHSFGFDFYLKVLLEKRSGSKHLKAVKLEQVKSFLGRGGASALHDICRGAFQVFGDVLSDISRVLADGLLASALDKEWRRRNTPKMGPTYEYGMEEAQAMAEELAGMKVPCCPNGVLPFLKESVSRAGRVVGLLQMLQSSAADCSRYSDCQLASQRFWVGQSSSQVREAVGLLEGVVGRVRQAVFGNGSKCLDSMSCLLSKEIEKLEQFSRHWHHFFLTVPAVCLFYLNTMAAGKSTNKRGREEANEPTDDGFPLGLAFILKVVAQEDRFESLRWFESMEGYYEGEVSKLENVLESDDQSGMAGLKLWGQHLASLSGEQIPDLILALRQMRSVRSEVARLSLTFSSACQL